MTSLINTGLVNTSMPLPAAQPFMPTGRLIGAYLTEAKFEFLGMLRTMAFAVPFLVLPLAIYLLFGVAFAAEAVAKDPNVANFLFCGFSVFAITGPALFGIGCSIAIERDAGLMKLRRALPAPAGAYIVAKMAMAMLFAALTFATLLIAGLLVGKLTLSMGQLAGIGVVLMLGALPFCAIGLFIGAYTSGAAAPALTNLVYLPMLWLGGLFIPLPKFLQAQTVIWPSFHLDQIVVGIAGLSKFKFLPTSLSVGVLAGVTILFGGLAIQRLARKG